MTRHPITPIGLLIGAILAFNGSAPAQITRNDMVMWDYRYNGNASL